ncbi:response regulator transcription factor [Bacillus mycoides]|uniref:response regulator transcription factor n=1 Tax=Bacillus mycoides TaxID=1405 RepID=UPI0010BF227A|nr:response regulator transcription factor [Bacillus mycoides]TKI39972.1 response regulator transcription factor [Bacillus mycoides]
MTVIKVMIVEDDPTWMICLSNFINKENDIAVVKKAFNEEEALTVNNNEIDVAVVDVTLSDDVANLSGLQVASRLNGKGLEKIIMLTSWEEKEVILEAFDIGVVNYVTKTSYKDIPDAIREAHNGKVSIHPDVSSVVVGALRKERKLKVLTPSEREVFELREEGLKKNQIAQKLFKSPETIKAQLKKIKQKITEFKEKK